jgi:hypothetical protein
MKVHSRIQFDFKINLNLINANNKLDIDYF